MQKSAIKQHNKSDRTNEPKNKFESKDEKVTSAIQPKNKNIFTGKINRGNYTDSFNEYEVKVTSVFQRDRKIKR